MEKHQTLTLCDTCTRHQPTRLNLPSLLMWNYLISTWSASLIWNLRKSCDLYRQGSLSGSVKRSWKSRCVCSVHQEESHMEWHSGRQSSDIVVSWSRNTWTSWIGSDNWTGKSWRDFLWMLMGLYSTKIVDKYRKKRPVQTFKLHFNLLQAILAVITLLLLCPHFLQTPLSLKRWTAQILFGCLFIENHVMNGR